MESAKQAGAATCVLGGARPLLQGCWARPNIDAARRTGSVHNCAARLQAPAYASSRVLPGAPRKKLLQAGRATPSTGVARLCASAQGKSTPAPATLLRTGGSCGNLLSQRTVAGALAAAAAAGVAAVAAAASAAAGPAAATVVAAAAAAAALQLMQLLQMQRRVQPLHQPQQSDRIFTAAAQQVHISSTAGLQQDSRSFATDPAQLCRSSTAALPQL